MIMTDGYVYVASAAMGASQKQTLNAFIEAEAYNGPSLVICYASCINHGIKKGMGNSQAEMKQAVNAGYWPLYRYNPALKSEGKNPFILDAKAPDGSLKEFLSGETRYASLAMSFPDDASKLQARLEEEVMDRYADFKKMAAS
jgi:pyruvate-ferredoxin/flavodoxin oxidoreductase